mgnify:CR=1 FL=1|tara:strand:+ start:308 stop:490 length:183 start_codon:yes stop_codon:yes gene_type:complete
MKYKNLHDINTFACTDNEVYLSGLDENGKDLTIVLNAFELLEWLDINYIKKQTIKHIKQL